MFSINYAPLTLFQDRRHNIKNKQSGKCHFSQEFQIYQVNLNYKQQSIKMCNSNLYDEKSIIVFSRYFHEYDYFYQVIVTFTPWKSYFSLNEHRFPYSGSGIFTKSINTKSQFQNLFNNYDMRFLVCLG